MIVITPNYQNIYIFNHMVFTSYLVKCFIIVPGNECSTPTVTTKMTMVSMYMVITN